jgi:hypothetical protein
MHKALKPFTLAGFEPQSYVLTKDRCGDHYSMLPGTDVMIFKIFSPKNSAKKLAFLTQNKAKLCKV